jgi:hypothetical protein
MRSKEFVGGTDQEIAAERRYIDQSMRPVVHRIDVGERPDGMSLADNIFNWF